MASVCKIDINRKSLPSCQIHLCTGCDSSRRRSEVSSPADQLLLLDMALFVKSADHAYRDGPRGVSFPGVSLVATRRNTDRSVSLCRAGRHSLRVRTVKPITALPGLSMIHDNTANYVASGINAPLKSLASGVRHRPTAALIGSRTIADIPVILSTSSTRRRV